MLSNLVNSVDQRQGKGGKGQSASWGKGAYGGKGQGKGAKGNKGGPKGGANLNNATPIRATHIACAVEKRGTERKRANSGCRDASVAGRTVTSLRCVGI